MKTALNIVIICFFVLMNIWLLTAIIQGLFYVIYQKTDRVYLSASSRCRVTGCYFTLEYKGKEIDKAFAYTKQKRCCYVLGLNGVYKIKKNRLETIDMSNLQINEAAIIVQMKKEIYDRVLRDQMLLQLYLADNGTENCS